MIPKRFIRIWLGDKPIPELFEQWWDDFKVIHTDWEFVTIKSFDEFEISDEIKELLPTIESYAGLSDILRLIVLYEMGGVYVDTDIKPIKSFDSLVKDDTPFLGKRSKVSFESAVIGTPKGHPTFKLLLEKLPKWVETHKENSASVQTGPAFISKYLFGRGDVRHLPEKTFYPFNGFGAPKRDEKLKMFENNEFPEEMICAHFSNHRWGGNPNKKKSTK
jgi:mannosyltransferase OCH1-like enzyme